MSGVLTKEQKSKFTKGDWMFTCQMRPQQFSHFTGNGTNYVTLEGSHHALWGCGGNKISEKYALWFIDNNCWELFPKNEKFQNEDDRWEKYANRIRELCERDGI